MGLFTNNKRPCPVCGKGTPRLLATEIAGDVHLCSDCSGKISMEVSRIGDMSMDDLMAHLALREENARLLREVFRPNKVYEIGWTHLNIDEANRLFTIPLNMCGDTKNPPIFKFDELTGYELEEENFVIERFMQGDVSPQYTSRFFIPQTHSYDKDDKQPQITTRSFKLNLYLNNPCWSKVESDAGSASGNDFNFQRDYNQHLNKLRFVTTALVNIIGQGNRPADQSGNTQGNADTVANELKKFKELQDSGIITSEEFDAKKKQLLGL